MANGQTIRLLEFANMQMAAEAFLSQSADDIPNRPPESEIKTRLEDGNRHFSKFMPLQAQQFVDKYEVLAQKRNDPLSPSGSGFSGTLFKNRATGELTLSFRSTEFIEDAVRDTKSTAELEIKDLGWALGQIAEMETWYAQLLADPNLLGGRAFNVTGYSLGGHLATAFNLLRREEDEAGLLVDGNPIINTYTFNGAGTGAILDGGLRDIMAAFNGIRADYLASPEWDSLSVGDRNTVTALAQSRINAITDERIRVAGLSGVGVAFGQPAPSGEQLSLGYQIAALLVGQNTVGASNAPFRIGGTNDVPTTPVFAPQSQRFANMTEVVGSDGGNLGPSWIANSGIHYGTRQETYIEDQPRTRGNYSLLRDRGSLIANPDDNNFADTHSLVLVVDSLSLMSAFERLDPVFSTETARQIFSVASAAKASSKFLTQGAAEGDTLERTLDALGRLFVAATNPHATPIASPLSLQGNTWHDLNLRQSFHAKLKELTTNSPLFSQNAEALKFEVKPWQYMLELAYLEGNAGLPWRYALKELNSFAVTGNPDAYAQLYAQHNVEGALGLYQPTTNQGGLTVDYLSDRARFLDWKNVKNHGNIEGPVRQRGVIQADFKDIAIGYEIQIRNSVVGGTGLIPPQKIIFGSDQSETGPTAIVGGSRADRLYGGGGDDQISGGENDDYLEGGSGIDTLEGGFGNDYLVGGVGDDILKGGEGLDTYVVGINRDLIQDEDGSGLVLDANGNRIAGRFVKQGSQYIFTANTAITATLNSPLTITLENGASVVIEGFDDGEFGIFLNEQPDAGIPPPDKVLTKSEGSDFFQYGFDNNAVTVRGLGGNDFVGVFTVPPGYPLPAQAGSVIEGGVGSDAVHGGGGDDRVFTTDAADLAPYLSGTASTTPGTEREVGVGSEGNDLVVGNTGSDWLAGGPGEDTIYGGAGNDVIAGGGEVRTGTFWSSGGGYEQGAPLPPLQDTMIFNVDIGTGVALSLEQLQVIEAAGRILRSGLNGADAEDGVDTIFAGAGDDEVWAGYGDDYVEGEGGADLLKGEEGDDTIFGGEGGDVLAGDVDDINLPFASHGADYLDGGGGDDTLIGQGGADTLYGGAGADKLHGDAVFVEVAFHGSDYLDGEGGNDLLLGYSGDDQLYGGDDTDELQGGEGDDYLDGEAGDDTLFGEAGADELYGSAGIDQLVGGTDDDYLDGGGDNDTLFGEAGADTLIGGSGNDQMDGGTEGDALSGGLGEDTLVGGMGDDTLTGGPGIDTLDGGAGSDTYVLGRDDGADVIIDTPGEGNRIEFVGVSISDLRLSQSGAGTTLNVFLGLGGDTVQITDALNGSIEQFQFLEGTSYSLKQVLDLATVDPITLTGTGTGVPLLGGSGNDSLTAANFDVLDGGRGDDTLFVAPQSTSLHFGLGDGADVMVGAGRSVALRFDESVDADSAFFTRVDAADPRLTTPRDLILHYGDGDSILIPDSTYVITNNYVFDQGEFLGHIQLLERSGLELQWLGSADAETVSGTSLGDQLAGNDGADRLDGQGGNDTLDGGAQNDQLEGGVGNDALTGDDGSDALWGGGSDPDNDALEQTGNDTLTGGTGSDRLTGGNGNDRYLISIGDGTDIVADNAGDDTIEFGAGIDLNDESVTAELVNGTDGNIYLAVGYAPGETVLIRQNFDTAVNEGAISFSFDGEEPVTASELSSLKFSAPVNFVGREQAIRITGSGFDDTLIGSSQDDRLEGAEGNDQIAGDAGHDTLIGGAGNDLLVGNAGDDTLEGDAGSDTYRLHRDMGQDTVVEVAGDLNTIALDANLSAGDLGKLRTGSDLYLHIKTREDGVVIKNYFVPGSSEAAQNWQITFAGGASTPLQEVIGTLEESVRPDTVEALITQYKRRAQAYYESALIASGYSRGSNGNFRKDVHSETRSGNSITSSDTLVTISFAHPDQTSDGSSIGRDTLPVDPGGTTVLSTLQADIQEQVPVNSTFVPHGSGGNRPAMGAGGTGATRYFDLNGSQYSGVGYPTGSTIAIEGSTIIVNPLTGASSAAVSGFRVFPGEPTYVTTTLTRTHTELAQSHVVNIEEINGGESGNQIETAAFAVVDGKNGDDILRAPESDSIYVPFGISGGLGTPQITLYSVLGAPGVLFYGEAGTDTLRGGNFDDVLIGGTGAEDHLEGGLGNDTYVMFSGDGVDEIFEWGATQAGLKRKNVLLLPDVAALTSQSFSWTEELITPPQSDLLAVAGLAGTEIPAQSLHAVLTVSFGTGDAARIVVPHAELNAGTGIDFIELGDGSRLSFGDVLDLAPVATLNPHRRDNELSGLGVLINGGPGDDVIAASMAIGGAGNDTLSGVEVFGGVGIINGVNIYDGSWVVGTLWDEGNIFRGGGKIWATAGPDVFEFELGEAGTVTDQQHDDSYLSYGGQLDVFMPGVDGDALEPAHRAALLANQDTLRFGPGILPQDITLVRITRSSVYAGPGVLDDLVFVRNGSEVVRFENWYTKPLFVPRAHNQLSRVEFENGTVWDRARINAMASLPHPVAGTNADDNLSGSADYDFLQGQGGNDFLAGALGDDVLDGGDGDDTYYFQPGDGNDTIQESGLGTFDVLSFGPGVTPEMLRLGLGSLRINVGDTGDAIHIEGFDPDDALNSGAIESFRFTDGGIELTYDELLARGFDISGTFAGDTLGGTSVADRISGFGGSDTLSSGSGDDELDGGSGDDVLQGGAGDDTYAFASFSGADRIEDSGGNADVITLGAGITTAATTVDWAGNFLHLSFGGTRGELSIQWQPEAGYRIETVEFFSGTVWDAATLEAMAGAPSNTPPVAAADSVAVDENAVTVNLVAALLGNDADEDIGDILRISSVDTTATAGTVAYDEIAQFLSYEASAAAHNALEQGVTLTDSFAYTVTDIAGATADATVTVTITGVNDAPLLATPLTDRMTTAGSVFAYTVPGGAFADVDSGDALTYSATRADGSGIPAWLSFNPVTGDFSGTPSGVDAGLVTIRVTATDSHNASASDEFDLTVASSVINGTAGNNTLNGTAGHDIIHGLAGNDTLNARSGNDILNGGSGNDTVNGNDGDDELNGNAGNDKLNGGAGKDTLNGGSGNDKLNGGSGDDSYVVDSAADVVTEASGAGTDLVKSSVSYTLGPNVEKLTLTGSAHIKGSGNGGNNVIGGNSRNNVLNGKGGNDTLNGGSGVDTLNGGAGNDLVNGGAGNDLLKGDSGNDVLEGMDGNDALNDTGGNNCLAGFAGSDTLTGNTGNEVFIGGAGNDTVTTGAGAEIIAFNRGDGQDTVNASKGQDDTVSLGLAIEYADLYFRRRSNDLILETGNSEQLTLKNWYAAAANHSVRNLQMVAESMAGYDANSADPLLNKKVQGFDFQELVDAFDQARAADPQLNRWALMDKLLDAHLAGSDSEAIGGDLTYRYGLTGSLAGIGLAPAQAILSGAQFGSAPQSLQPLASLQQGPMRLS